MIVALGSPSITVPNALDVRAIAMAIGNTRQRIEALESAVNALSSASSTGSSSSGTSTTAAQISALRTLITQLTARVVVLENAAGTDIVTYTASETIAAGQGVIPLPNGSIGVADPSDPTRMFGLLGLALNNASSGSSVQVQRRGFFATTGYSFTIGRAVYVTFDGLTQTPDYDATALPVGVATDANILFVAPEWPALLTPLYSSSIENSFTDYLPVTYRALQFLAGLEAQIDALPFSSGVDAHAQVPVAIGGIAVRVNAADIAALAVAPNAALFQLAISDLTTPLAISSSDGYFDAPYAFTLTYVIGTVLVASSSGLLTFQIRNNSVAILSTAITIDVGETSSLTATTPPVIGVAAINKGDRLTFDITAAGADAKGAQITLGGTIP